MKENNQENDLKTKIKEFNFLPYKVDLKIEKTLEKLPSHSKKDNPQMKKIVSIVASILLLFFVCGNVFTYATEKTDLVSYLFDKFNIREEFQKQAVQIGSVQESNGIKVSVKEIALNDDLLIIHYFIQSDKPLRSSFFLSGEKTLHYATDKQISLPSTSLGERRNKQQITVISDTEYDLYEVYPIDELPKDNSLELTLFLKSLQLFEESPDTIFIKEEIAGKWNFTIPLDYQNSTASQTFSFTNQTIALGENGNLELHEIRISSLATVFNTYLEDKKGQAVSLEITDNKNTVLLAKNTQQLNNGWNLLLGKKIDSPEEVTITVYEYGTQKVIGKKKISLEKETLPSNQSKAKTISFQDITLTLPEQWEVYEDPQHNLFISVYPKQTSSRKQLDSMIAIRTTKNSSSNTLEELKEDLKIQKQIGVNLQEQNYFAYHSDLNKYTLMDKKDYEKANSKFTLSKQEIRQIIQGETIQKAGKTITKSEISDVLVADGMTLKKEEQTKIGGKQAYKLSFQSDGPSQIVCVFLHNQSIYEISYDSNSKQFHEIESMIQNMKIN